VAFADVDVDIFEQSHFNSSYNATSDYEMYIPNDLKPNQVQILKIIKTDEKVEPK